MKSVIQLMANVSARKVLVAPVVTNAWTAIMIFQAVIHVNARLKDQVLKSAMSKTDSVLAIPNMEDVNVTNVPLDFSIIQLVILVVAISKFEWTILGI